MRKHIDRVFSAFEFNLVPIIVTVAASYVLFAPAQFREIYRGFAQRIASLQTVEVWSSNPDFWAAVTTLLYTLAGLTVLSVLVWLTCRANLDEAESSVSAEGTVNTVAAGARRLVGLSLVALPFLALSLGLYAASSSKDAVANIKGLLARIKEIQLRDAGADPSVAHEAAVGWASQLASYNDMLIGSAVVFALLGLLLVFLLNRFENSARADAVGRAMSSGYTALGAAVVFLALCLVYSSEAGAAAARISAAPILCMFAALSLVVVNYLAVQSGAAGRLAVWLLATVAVVFSLFDFSNNHRVRRIPYAAQASPTTPDLSDAFLKWYNARTDQSKFPGRYPIYVVAAQGGGIYAALHAATFLSYMQERCPNFAHHLFAISGVSGGSVGAAVFAASMKEAELRGTVKIPSTGCNSQVGGGDGPALLSAASDVLDDDFWSPLQAMWLFPDLLQQFIPYRVEMFDRARALENGLEASWQRMMTRSELFGPRLKAQEANTLAEPFISLWPAGFDKSLFTPALVLNTTEVDTGRRRLIAPFRFEGLTDLRFFPANCVAASVGQASGKIESVPLSTAAVLSARFPWITPTGWYYETTEMGPCAPPVKSVTKVSDGGYFESSGVATALDLTHSLQKVIAEHKLPVDIKLVILTSGGFASETADGLNEALDPIRTMLNASEARGYIEVGRAEQADYLRTDAPSGAVLKVRLEEYGYPLPLGWSLSTVTRYLIQFQTGTLNPCQRKQGPPRIAVDVNSSSCVVGDLIGQLTHP